MNRKFLATGAVLGALSVILGAFAAHGLKERLPADAVAVFETGVRYQFYHCFALLFTAVLSEKFPGKWMQRAGYLFITGIILFSGSLYALTIYRLTGITGLTFITAILTPFGGLFFIAGWPSVLTGIYRK
jgi:uncharacterized membrane protein YgdD (TMEM256/DUF423 family)